MRTDTKYFNFPIQLLDGFLTDSNIVLNNICDYAIYEHSLKLEFGTALNRITASAKYFNVKLGSISATQKNGEQHYDSISQKSPKAGINLTVFWDFFKNDKTEYEKVCLLAFLAIKSILQKKPYCKLANNYLLARMSGKTHSCPIEELPAEVKKYSHDYQIRKIKTSLRGGWGLVTYARYTRGFYVSYTMNLEALVYEAEKRRKSVKEKQYKQQQNEALQKALLKLNA